MIFLKRFKIFQSCKYIILVLSCVINCKLCVGDIFNAQVELESLFDLRQSVSDAVSEYLQKEELRLALVREKLLLSSGLSRVGSGNIGERGGIGKDVNVNANVKKVSEGDEAVSISSSSRDSEGKLEKNENHDGLNPINAFLAIKALTGDLAEVLKPALDSSNIKELRQLMDDLADNKKFPDSNDLKGAAVALTRLQDTYLLKTELLSKGCLQHDFCTVELSVEDCFEIGKQSYSERSYDHAIIWFEEALRKLEMEEKSLEDSHNETRLIQHDSFGSSKIKSVAEINRRSLAKISQKAEIFDYLSWARDIKNTLNVGKQFLAELTGLELDAFIDEVVKTAESSPTEGEAEDNYSTVLKKFDALCRGESRETISQNPTLKCSLSNRSGNPYFILGRVKEEQLSIDPPLWVFHDVIYDQEIEVIKRIAKPMFKTATVVNSATGGTQQSTTRVSKSAWVIDEDDDVIAKVNQRIKELSNLDLGTAEDLQVANYGIGGMYLPHFDFSHTNETIQFLPKEEGNRIATLMFYLSETPKFLGGMGGGTAFPHLNITIWPEKGAAAFWYNLKPDGRGDYRTQHGACPVLIGSKWVANKWIHERGQEFIRKCELKPNGPKHRSIDT